jgi:hypothetical protein
MIRLAYVLASTAALWQVDADASRTAIEFLRGSLSHAGRAPAALDKQPFASVPLTRADAAEAQRLLWQFHVRLVRQDRAAEIESRQLRDGDATMPFFYEVYGEKPASGRSLFISMHGGGGTTKQVNDQQWENQKRLYRPDEGMYLVPRAPTDSWDLWHQPHIDRFLDRLIEDLIVLEGVDPNRVYLMGYSAGGDGVYQLAPRMADRWAAAAMMAGHPNGASPVNLRNVAFTIHVGGNDSAYGRNKVAGDWQAQLAALHDADPAGYTHLVKIYPDKGHWLGRDDASAVPWMARFSRDPVPKRIVWRYGGPAQRRSYWLAMIGDEQSAGVETVAELDGQRIRIESRGQKTSSSLNGLVIRLNDEMLDLDAPVTISFADEVVFHGIAPRTIGALARTLAERGDPKSVFSSEIALAPAAEDRRKPPYKNERPAAGRFRVIGYLPYYRIADIDPDVGKYLTDMVYFSAEVGPNGELVNDRLKNEHLEKLRSIKQDHRVALYLCVGGWGRSAGFVRLAASPDARHKFTEAATQFCLENEFDGIDLDWEHPAGDEQYANFVKLLEDLKRRFEPHDLRLSVAAAGWQALPAEAIAAVDRIHLMAYDADGRHSTPRFARAEVDKLINRGVGASKICLGVPFYGRGIDDRAKTLTYAQIVRRHEPASDVDEVDGTYFNGPETIARKTRDAIESKLGGIMVWELGQDAPGDRSLLRVIHRTVKDERGR